MNSFGEGVKEASCAKPCAEGAGVGAIGVVAVSVLGALGAGGAVRLQAVRSPMLPNATRRVTVRLQRREEEYIMRVFSIWSSTLPNVRQGIQGKRTCLLCQLPNEGYEGVEVVLNYDYCFWETCLRASLTGVPCRIRRSSSVAFTSC